MPGEAHALRLRPGGLVGDGPGVEVRAILQDEVELSLRDGDGRGREAQDLRLRERRGGGGVGAAHLFALERDGLDGVLRAGHERIEGQIAAGDIGQTRLVAVGVGAGDVERAAFLAGLDLHGQIVRADVGHGHGADERDGRHDDEEPHRRADRGQRRRADEHRQQPPGRSLCLFPTLTPRGQVDLQLAVVLRGFHSVRCLVVFRSVLQIFVETDGVLPGAAAVDLVDDGVEHPGVGGEALLEVVGHLLGVGKLDRLDLLLGVRVDGLGLALDGRDDQRVGGLVALAVFQQRLLQLLRRLIPVLGLEGAGLQHNVRHLIIGVHRGRQLLAGDAQLVRRAGGGLFILKRAVVAVVDAVEDHADGIDVGRRLDRPEQAEQLRRGERAEHGFRHGAVFELVDLRDAQIAQQIVARAA